MHIESMSSPRFGASPNDIPVLDRETTVYETDSLYNERDDIDEGPPVLTRAPVICFSTFPDPKYKEVQERSLLENEPEKTEVYNVNEESPISNKSAKMRKRTFRIDDILARIYPEEKVETPTIFAEKQLVENCKVTEETKEAIETETAAKLKVECDDGAETEKLECPKSATVTRSPSEHILMPTSMKQADLEDGILPMITNGSYLALSKDVLSDASRPSTPLTPSLDPELLRRLEEEDTPKRVLRASTIAVTKSSLAKKEFTFSRMKRKPDDEAVRQPKKKRAKINKETLVVKRYDTPIEVKITDEPSLCTPSSSGVSSMSSSSSSNSSKGRGRKKLEQNVESNWRPATAGEKHYTYYSNDNAPVKRICYAAVQHVREPETIRVYDAVIVNSEDGSRNIGKVARIFLDERTGLLMATVFWYYTSEQVELDKKAIDPPLSKKELLASRHIDVIPMDTIQEVVYVLTFNEYNRYVAENKIDALYREQRPKPEDEVWPRAENAYYRRGLLPCEDSLPDLVYFCRRIYDFKQKRITTNRPVVAKKSVAGRKIMTGRRGTRH